jgi:hypothetical protein
MWIEKTEGKGCKNTPAEMSNLAGGKPFSINIVLFWHENQC